MVPGLVCPRCAATDITGMEYRLTTEDYDGVSEWSCNHCGVRWGRWTGRVLAPGELEPRYGARRYSIRATRGRESYVIHDVVSVFSDAVGIIHIYRQGDSRDNHPVMLPPVTLECV